MLPAMAFRPSLALVALLATCQPAQHGGAPPPAPSPPQPAATATEPAPAAATATATATAAAVAVDAGPDAPPAPLPRLSDSKLVGCLAQRCKVGSESCCVYSNEGDCVASVPPGPNDKVQVLASQLEACNATKHDYSLTEIRRCDESSDCARGEACCSMFMFGGASADLCVPFKTPGRSPCDFVEICIDDSTCRTSGSMCIDGACRKATTLTCGGKRCSGDKGACCGDPPSCRAPADCEHGAPRYRCTSPKDCLPGEHCQFAIVSTTCTNFVDIANTRTVCDTSADCPKSDMFCKRYACKAEQHGIKTCQCG